MHPQMHAKLENIDVHRFTYVSFTYIELLYLTKHHHQSFTLSKKNIPQEMVSTIGIVLYIEPIS